MARTAATMLPDWLRPHLQWIVLPSWLISLVLHGTTFALLAFLSRLPGCQADLSAEQGTDLREVGLFYRADLKTSGDSDSIEPTEDATNEPVTDPSELPTTVTAPDAVSDDVPVDLLLPTRAPLPQLGAGGPPRTAAGVDQLLNPLRNPGGRVSAPEGQPGGGGGKTSLFGISDSGGTFVYVIDSSSSMDNYGALRVAKLELQGSLENLSEEQQFQVIFSNSQQLVQLDPGRFDMFYGTDSQRIEARLQIAGVSADGGTDHLAALMAALEFNADVIFYLTDAGEPYLLAGDLEKIKRRNGGRSRIHCIEFGQGSPFTDSSGKPTPNFLTKLASQNDGQYTYRDVRTFGGR
jgi:hypothetical protein